MCFFGYFLLPLFLAKAFVEASWYLNGGSEMDPLIIGAVIGVSTIVSTFVAAILP